ncbi:MAG: tyrosine-type recombinase/integrase [Marinovum sp.]|nr:tyrosine-type recombinase/integrase [Marinovum sp.]
MEIEEDELPYTVFQRYDNGTYAMRFTLGGHGQIRIGLRTRDLAKAHRLAERKYMEATIRAEQGLVLGVASFDKLAQDYIKSLEAKAKDNPQKLKGYRYAAGVVNRYLVPYFGRKNISAILYKDLVGYKEWRKTYWTTGDGKDQKWLRFERGHKNLKRKAPTTEATEATLKRETSIVRGVFMQGVEKGFLKASDIPAFPTTKSTDTKRPAFTKEQFDHLVQVATQRMLETENPKQLYERTVLLSFIVFAANTGMRTMEMRNLDWRHIENFHMMMDKPPTDLGDIGIWAFGKGLPPQKLIPRNAAVGALERLFLATTKYFGEKPKPTDPVFVNFKGERVASFKSSLKALLTAAGLEKAGDGSNFTAYCFRHSYATWALQRDPPVDVYTLSNNMRTSVEMIQKWYGKVRPEDQKRVLRGMDEKPEA